MNGSPLDEVFVHLAETRFNRSPPYGYLVGSGGGMIRETMVGSIFRGPSIDFSSYGNFNIPYAK